MPSSPSKGPCPVLRPQQRIEGFRAGRDPKSCEAATKLSIRALLVIAVSDLAAYTPRHGIFFFAPVLRAPDDRKCPPNSAEVRGVWRVHSRQPPAGGSGFHYHPR